MERVSRTDLLSTISNQKDQLQQYKTKLRDVVAAYKSVAKEKEALEASVAVLSAGHNERAVQNALDGSVDHYDGNPDPLGVGSNIQEHTDELSSLKNQLKTLSSSLTTLTQEKNKIEANFIADKKQMKQEIEDLNLKLTEERQRTSTQAEGFEIQITNLKSRLRTQQLEGEKEQTNHALMLKELQMLLSKERMNKEHLTKQLEDAQKSWKESEERWSKTPLLSEVYEHQIHELQRELTSVRDHMKTAELKSNQPSPFVLELQQEMERVKDIHQRQVAQEQMKAYESEFKLQSQAKQSEDRVSSLEAKLSELSQTVGNYERLKFQDQQSISKLRERITQLDLENSALVHAANLTYQKQDFQEVVPSEDEILDKIMHLRDLLLSASEKSDIRVKMSSIFVKDLNKSDEESTTCKQYKSELEAVKEEFERYKLRAQSVLKTKNKDNSTKAEIDVLREQNSEFRSKLRSSDLHHQEDMNQRQTKVDSLSKALLVQEDRMKIEFSQMKSCHQKEIGQLEQELKKQRERSIALLSEKDYEIQKMLQIRGFDVDHFHHDAVAKDISCRRHEIESEEQKAVNELLSLPKEVDNEVAFLHYSQEKARTHVEISTLRKQKRELETIIRENSVLAKQKESHLRDQISALQECNAEIERQSHREGANLEYLKNVLLKFLTSTDVEGKKQMMKAFMTILQFSPQESQKVQQVYSKGWWTS